MNSEVHIWHTIATSMPRIDTVDSQLFLKIVHFVYNERQQCLKVSTGKGKYNGLKIDEFPTW